jgi:hypothetical protein
VTLSSLIGGGGYWDRVGTVLSTSTAGDDIEFEGDIYGSNSLGPMISNVASSATVPNILPRKASAAEGIGSAGGAYLNLIANSKNIVQIYGGTLEYIRVAGAIEPATTGTENIGGTTLYWNLLYITQINFEDVNTHISQDGSGNLYFYDTNTGGKTLADLSGGVSASGTPANDQVAVWTNATTIEGSANLTFDGTDLTVSGDVTATDFNLSSDVRLKDVYDVVEDGLDIVMQLRPIRYRWKDHRDDYIHIGFTTQEVEKVRPELVKYDVLGFGSMSYAKISAINTAAIQTLEKKIQMLEKKLKELKDGGSS